MPCYDHTVKQIAEENVEHIQKLTRMLCSMCKYHIEQTLVSSSDLRDVQEWWIAHKEMDEEIRQDELNEIEEAIISEEESP